MHPIFPAIASIFMAIVVITYIAIAIFVGMKFYERRRYQKKPYDIEPSPAAAEEFPKAYEFENPNYSTTRGSSSSTKNTCISVEPIEINFDPVSVGRFTVTKKFEANYQPKLKNFENFMASIKY